MIFFNFLRWNLAIILWADLNQAQGLLMATTGVPSTAASHKDSTGSVAATLHFREKKMPKKVLCKSYWKHYFFAAFLLLQSHCVALGWAGTCQCRPGWPPACVDSPSLHHDCWNYRCEPPCPEEGINLCSNKWINTIVKVTGSMKENTQLSMERHQSLKLICYMDMKQNYLHYLKKTHHIN